ncbi:hypothetical protein FORC065_4507 [Yersinia enterocolitica]|nr:hypothetical protein FORC065_4507 [Yersinia enterocolitica]
MRFGREFTAIIARLPCQRFNFFSQYKQTYTLRLFGYKYIVLYYFLT